MTAVAVAALAAVVGTAAALIVAVLVRHVATASHRYTVLHARAPRNVQSRRGDLMDELDLNALRRDQVARATGHPPVATNQQTRRSGRAHSA